MIGFQGLPESPVSGGVKTAAWTVLSDRRCVQVSPVTSRALSSL
uniref:Uncharacterized protein n=1 Tax=Trichinella nativa TaxID=6335 RepID=A0A0V1KIQ7_9BILA